MQAILLKSPGGVENMYIGSTPIPPLNDYEILVKIKATALNRADTLQRQGKYPVPPSDSLIMGLEMSGIVSKVGKKVNKWKVGDFICGLTNGGSYAEYVAIHEQMALPIPNGLDFKEAAAIPEVFLTAYQALVWLAKVQKGESVLIHAGASGVGTAAIQLARLLDLNKVFVTASAGKHQICYDLGADLAIDYKTEDFAKVVNEKTKGQGVQTVIDFIAAPYFKQNLQVLGTEGRLVMLALMGGVQVDAINIAPILIKRLQVIGTTLRPRSIDYKIELTKGLQDLAWKHFESGQIKPIIDSVYSWKDVQGAHQRMEANLNQGKIIMEIA